MTLAVVLQVRAGTLCVLLWQRARDPFAAPGRCPAATSARATRSSARFAPTSPARSTSAELSWLEQLETLSQPDRHPGEWQLATAYLGLVPLGLDPALPGDTAWHPIERLPELAFDHEAIVLAGRERLRAKLSYTNIAFALAPESFSISELSGIYTAALGYPIDPTNLRRVLERRGVLEATGERRSPGREGGPARRRLPLRLARARGDGPVRRAAAAAARITPNRGCSRQVAPSGRGAAAKPIFTGVRGREPPGGLLERIQQQAEVERRRGVRQRSRR